MEKFDIFVSVVAPLYQDAKILEDYVQDVAKILRENYTNYELILVDDGSIDATTEVVDRLLSQVPCVRLLRLSRHFGLEIAISAGLDSAIGDFVVVMQPDVDPPREIPQMVELSRNGVGIVIGMCKKQKQSDSLLAQLVRPMFYAYCRRVIHSSLHQDATHFRVLSRDVVNALTRIKDKDQYLRTNTVSVGFGSTQHRYTMISRSGKSRGRGGFELIRVAAALVVANSVHPLQVVGLLGIVVSLTCLVCAVASLILRQSYPQVFSGGIAFTLLSLVLLFVMLVLFVQSVYLGYLLQTSRNRPAYFIMEERNSQVLLADEQRRNVLEEST